jgi:peptidoglycan lytic transglycosylase F
LLVFTKASIFDYFAVPLTFLLLAGGCSPVSESLVKKARVSSEEHAAVVAVPVEIDKTSSCLPQSDKLMVRSYGAVVKRYSRQYGLDWRLVLAVMKAESRFAVDAESPKGASGLMQIMPVTSTEVAKMLDIDDMAHPKNNIRGGIFYLKRLYDLFEGSSESDRLRLTLAAYNAGVGRIYDAQVLAAYLQDNPLEWESVKEALPLLSKRYYTLHQNVWDQDRPKIAGWFGNSKETITYVSRVMGYYEEYEGVLN